VQGTPKFSSFGFFQLEVVNIFDLLNFPHLAKVLLLSSTPTAGKKALLIQDS
jgi:hypothetical protein